MSEIEQEQAVAPVAEAEALPPEPVEDDIPEAVEVAPGQKVVPVGVVKALREQVKALKPLADRTTQLESELREIKPFADFVKQNPQLLQPPKIEAPVVQPQDDPELVDLARTLDLYDASTGKPDVSRAAKVRDLNRKTAKEAAEAVIGPVQETTNEQRAAANLQHIAATMRDANGQPLKEAHLLAAVRGVTGQLSKADAVKILADPNVMQVIGLTALGIQAASEKAAPVVPAPSAPPLQVESAGGQTSVVMSDGSKRLARLSGVTDKDWAERAKRYQPGKSNVLE